VLEMGDRLAPLWKDVLLVDDTQKLFRAEMDASYSKITQRLFAACQLKLALSGCQLKDGVAQMELWLIVACCG
jgi:hypothetical protein